MQPTSGNVFVQKSDSKQTISKFEIHDSSEAKYEVTAVASDVVDYKVGDFVLFTDYKEYTFDGEKIYIVNQEDIKAFKTNSELKK